MKNLPSKIVFVLFGILLSASPAYALSVFIPQQGGTGTAQVPTLGQVLVGQSNGTYLPQATSTLGISGTGGVSSFNTRTGAVTLSSGDVTTALGYTPSSFSYPFPANATTSALSLGGLTVTNLGTGTVNANSSGTLYTSGTTTASCSGSVSCSTFAIFGSSPITISGSGAINALSTTSPWTIGSLAYVVDNSHVSSVATSTLTAGSGLTGSFTQVSTGGSVGCATANTSTFGCLNSTDWNTFNNKSSFGYPFPISGNATSTLTQFNGGLTAYASSTIGNGTATSGLTVNGGATTTGDVIFYPNGQSRGGFVVDYNNPASTTPNVSHEDSLTLIGDDNDFPAIYEYAYHFRTLFEGYAADGSLGTPTNTKSGAELVRLGGRGYGTTGYTGTASAVSLFAAQDWSDTAQGAWVGIRTTPIGSTGGGSQQIPPVIAAFTASGGLIVGSTTASGGGQFTYSPSNFAFYATDPGNGNIVANGITTVNATTTNATTTTLTLLGTTACNTGNALTTNALGNVVCGTTGSGSGTVGSGTTGQFPYYAASGTTLTATSSLFLAASGNVGIGNTAPLFPLHVSSNGSATIGQIALTDTNAVSSVATWLLSSQGGVFSIGTTTAAGATTTPSAISINNAGNMAIDTTINTNTALNVGYTFTTGAGLKQALSAGSTYTGSNANAQVVSGSYTSTFQGTVNNTSVGAAAIGGRFNAVNNTTGLNALNIYGVFSTVTNNGAFSSTTNAVEFFGSPPTAPAGTTITNSYGMRISGNATEAGSIVNGAGVDVDNLFTIATNTTEVLLGTNTIPSGRFAIYQSDSNNNYFAGNLGIGTTSPYAALSVVSNISTLFAIATSSATAPVLTLDNFGFLSKAGGDKPTATSCGTGSSVATGSNDSRGAITEGTLATGCVITFAHTIPANSFCTTDSESGLAFSYSNSNTAITITNIGALSSTQINYQCD